MEYCSVYRRQHPTQASATERHDLPNSTRGRAHSRLTRLTEHAVQYRCYFLNLRSEVAGVEIIEADSDSDALNRADTLFREKGSGFGSVAVWDRSRRVGGELNDGPEQIRRRRATEEEIRTAADGFAHDSTGQHMRNSAETDEALANAAAARLARRKSPKAEELREQAHLCQEPCRNATTVETRREHASRAFALAQLAEKIEREEAAATAAS